MALDDEDDEDDDDYRDLWVGSGTMYRSDWLSTTPDDLWDERHEHLVSTHNQAKYPDPVHCAVCYDGAVQVISSHQDYALRSAAHAARNARDALVPTGHLDTSRDTPNPDPGRRLTRQLTIDLRMGFAVDAADRPGEYHWVPSNDVAEKVAWWLVTQGWKKPI